MNTINTMMEKLNELPDEAQYVIMGAGALIAILIIVLILFLVLKIAAGSSRSEYGREKVKIPKRLPVAPLKLMTPEEAALLDALEAVARRHDGYRVFPKVPSQSIVGSRPDEHKKIKKAIEKIIIKDVHDYVMFDRKGFPIAVIEYQSKPTDKREEQARKSGLAIVRITDARMTPDEIESRMHGLFKTG